MRKSKMTPQERRFRSQLAKLLTWSPYLHATLNERTRTCGQKRCECYKGKKHESLFVSRSRQAQIRHLYVPREWEGKVRQWVKQYQQIVQLMDQISDIYWKKIQKRDK